MRSKKTPFTEKVQFFTVNSTYKVVIVNGAFVHSNKKPNNI